MSDVVSRLTALAGFDPAKQPTTTKEIFAEVVADIHKERAERAKVAAREQLLKAFELREKMSKVEREFLSQKAKFDKELGKMLNRLEASLQGRPPPTDEPEAGGEAPAAE